MVFSVLWEKPPLKFSEINRGYGNSVSAVKKQSFLLEVKTNQMAAALVELKFITGAMDVDKEWDNYVSQIQSMGIEQAAEYQQAALDRYFAR